MSKINISIYLVSQKWYTFFYIIVIVRSTEPKIFINHNVPEVKS